MAEGSEDILVAARLSLARDSWSSELQGAKSDLERFKTDASQMELRVRAVIDDQITPALERIRAEAAANPIRIPVILDAGSMSGGGGGGGGLLNRSSGRYPILPATDIADIFGIEMGDPSSLHQDYRQHLARTANRPAGVTPYEMNEFSGTGEFALKPLASLPAAEAALAETPASAATSGLASAENAAVAASGGRRGGFRTGGMAGRMMMMELARLPIEHLAQQNAAWQKVSDTNISGTSAQSTQAMIAAMQAQASGIGAVTGGFFGDPAQAARGLEEGQAAISTQQMLLSIQGRGEAARFGTQASFAELSGDTMGARRIERKSTYNQSVRTAQEKSRTESETNNPTGKRATADLDYKNEVRRLTDENTTYDTEAGSSTVNHARLDPALLGAKSNYDAILKGISNAQAKIANAANAQIAEAKQLQDAGNAADVNKNVLSDLRSGIGNFDIQEGGRKAMQTADSASASEHLSADRSAFEKRINLEKNYADAIQDTNDKKRERDRIDAEATAGRQGFAARAINISLANTNFGNQTMAMASRGAGNFGLAVDQERLGAEEIINQQYSRGSAMANERIAAMQAVNTRGDAMRGWNMRMGTLESHLSFSGDTLSSSYWSIAQWRQNAEESDPKNVTAIREEASERWDQAQKADTQRGRKITDEIKDLQYSSPWRRQLETLKDQFNQRISADPAHAAEITQLRDATLRDREIDRNFSVQRSYEHIDESNVRYGTQSITGTHREASYQGYRLVGRNVQNTPNPAGADAMQLAHDMQANLYEAGDNERDKDLVRAQARSKAARMLKRTDLDDRSRNILENLHRGNFGAAKHEENQFVKRQPVADGGWSEADKKDMQAAVRQGIIDGLRQAKAVGIVK